jgi:hypothetical protein
MNRDPRHKNPYYSDRKLRDIDNAHVFDETSGLYKPKSYASEGSGDHESSAKEEKAPLAVTVTRDWINVWLSIGTLLVVAAYTFYASREVDLMKNSQQRAWIKIETDTIVLGKPLDIGFVGVVGVPPDKLIPPDRGTMPMPEEKYPDPYPGISLETEKFPIAMQNFGNLPARQTTTLATILAITDKYGGAVWPAGSAWIDYGCERAKFRFETSGVHRPFFPGKLQWDEYAEVVLPPDVHSIEAYDIVVCIQYQDVYGETSQFHETAMHHTAVLYCGGFSYDDKNLIKVPTQTGVLSYTPTLQFKACQADAD